MTKSDNSNRIERSGHFQWDLRLKESWSYHFRLEYFFSDWDSFAAIKLRISSFVITKAFLYQQWFHSIGTIVGPRYLLANLRLSNIHLRVVHCLTYNRLNMPIAKAQG